MEHIVQFAIGIDDNAIVKRVTENAEKQIIAELSKVVHKEMFVMEPDYYGNRNRIVDVNRWVKDRFDEFLEANKDKIIEAASDKLADKLSRTKAVKEAAVAAVSEK